ncbi:PDR/VanB family oxidoreductase [Microbacterium thalassium]|uniref:Ferredoxin-NADP reductase n=1 Tax=Microbacterium thalassium TaxID=362649 RepID=A0A7X0FN37_9MICO|nr:PDR/VanB family oxidoreductase [Microbacterium thalassium]MBB6390553.1 ferredoxin-NADP reductase [Microbacterium thalassium]GLK25664.1 ferredoxin [Microbacterium thalassium]
MTIEAIIPARLDLAAVVEDSVRVADEVVAVTIRTTADDLPQWEPGAHLDIELPGGIIRQYSLCGDPDDRRRLRIAVLREQESRGGSRAVHDLAVGTSVRILAIRNHFPLDAADHYVFVAGGIGIAPLLPMIAHAEASGAPWVLHYAGRSISSMAYADALVDQHGPRIALYAREEGARLDLDAVIAGAPTDAGLYCCGPAGMMEQFEQACLMHDRDGHMERFAAAADKSADIVRPDDEAFEVHLARTGVTVQVQPGQSILAVAEEAGGDVFGSCEEGICGTCETRVIEGNVDHRDDVLCGRDTGTMMICVSRALSRRLVIDA